MHKAANVKLVEQDKHILRIAFFRIKKCYHSIHTNLLRSLRSWWRGVWLLWRLRITALGPPSSSKWDSWSWRSMFSSCSLQIGFVIQWLVVIFICGHWKMEERSHYFFGIKSHAVFCILDIVLLIFSFYVIPCLTPHAIHTNIIRPCRS